MNYITRYGPDCVGHNDINRMSCEEQARIYKGGKAGCKGPKAQQFANSVLQCCGKPSVYILLSTPFVHQPIFAQIMCVMYMDIVLFFSSVCPSVCLSFSGFYLGALFLVNAKIDDVATPSFMLILRSLSHMCKIYIWTIHCCTKVCNILS